MSNKNHYLSDSRVMARSVASKLRLVFGGFLTVFFGFGVAGALVNINGNMREFLLMYVVLTLPGIWLFYRGVKISRQIGAARRYEGIFSGDYDGVVTMQELSLLTGKKEASVRQELEELFQDGYFHNCYLRNDGVPAVILPDASESDEGTGFVTVRCRNCGATSRIRAGRRGKCQYCGAPVDERMI